MIDINMDEKVTVINLAPWNVGFPNLVGRGETCFAPSAKVRVKRDEISDQVSSGNKLLDSMKLVLTQHFTLMMKTQENILTLIQKTENVHKRLLVKTKLRNGLN